MPSIGGRSAARDNGTCVANNGKIVPPFILVQACVLDTLPIEDCSFGVCSLQLA